MTPKIRIIQRLLIFFALLCALTALPGCGSREPGVCTVTYTYEGEVLQELQLTRGEALPAYTPEIPGMRFVSWMDKGAAWSSRKEVPSIPTPYTAPMPFPGSEATNLIFLRMMPDLSTRIRFSAEMIFPWQSPICSRRKLRGLPLRSPKAKIR